MRNWIQKGKEGATVVEFAVIVPVLFIILFGIIEYGIIFMQIHLVENAAREGVRRGVVADTYDCWDDTNCEAPRYTAVVVKTQEYLAAFYPNLTDTPGNENVVTVEKDPASGNHKGLIVKVKVDNFMPKIISALLGDRFAHKNIRYTARGEYENSDEE